jgi:mono/diheme cytochrome c family protein
MSAPSNTASLRQRLRARMPHRRRAASALIALPLAALGISACGTQGISLSKSNPDYSGAVIFRDHCSGCHTLAVVGAQGSATSIQNRVKTNAPNFNFRKETVEEVLYAIRNGGFSGDVMPENVVVGKQAQQVAEFLSKYSGLQAPKEPGQSTEAQK